MNKNPMLFTTQHPHANSRIYICVPVTRREKKPFSCLLQFSFLFAVSISVNVKIIFMTILQKTT